MADHVEFCQSNLCNGTEMIYHMLRKRKDLHVNIFSCLGNCHRCLQYAHAIVNGQRVKAHSPTLLLDLVNRMLVPKEDSKSVIKE